MSFAFEAAPSSRDADGATPPVGAIARARPLQAPTVELRAREPMSSQTHVIKDIEMTSHLRI